MNNKKIEINVFGAEQTCPSCVNLPSSKETCDWLEAAVSRKFPNQPFQISYIDIFQPPMEEEKRKFAQRVIEEDLFYPVVVIEGEIVGEGNPRLKTIYSELEKYGYVSK
ncbi:YuzD family protein [Bacillus sp. 03113]|uniref:YuzD family protein n=1 Tax=Bacillus sp. 03113 TaxID=2578211 RepID=UPI0011436246|nr:YuzD family protein [Bacillus sp. 03113]